MNISYSKMIMLVNSGCIRWGTYMQKVGISLKFKDRSIKAMRKGQRLDNKMVTMFKSTKDNHGHCRIIFLNFSTLSISGSVI